MATCNFEGLLEGMEANSGSCDEPDSVFIPEDTLQSFLGVSGPDLGIETSRVANENGWTVKHASDGHWQFERKGS